MWTGNWFAPLNHIVCTENFSPLSAFWWLARQPLMTSTAQHTGWIFNRHADNLQRSSEGADKLRLGTPLCPVNVMWKHLWQASKQQGHISKKLWSRREPWLRAGPAGQAQWCTGEVIPPVKHHWKVCRFYFSGKLKDFCTALGCTAETFQAHNALLPSAGIPRWCQLSAWMLQGRMLSTFLEGCTLLMQRHYFHTGRCTNNSHYHPWFVVEEISASCLGPLEVPMASLAVQPSLNVGIRFRAAGCGNSYEPRQLSWQRCRRFKF